MSFCDKKENKRMPECRGGKFREHAIAYKKGVYNQTTLWIDNDQRLYNQKEAFFKNYCRKMLKGKFDRNLAKKGFKHLIDEANKLHKKEIGEPLEMDDRRVAENILVKDFEYRVKDEGGCENIAGYKKK